MTSVGCFATAYQHILCHSVYFHNVSGSAVREHGVFIILPAVLRVLTLKEKNAKNSENKGLLALC